MLYHYGRDRAWWDALPWWEQRMYLEELGEITGQPYRVQMPEQAGEQPTAGPPDTAPASEPGGWSTTPLGPGTGGPPPAQKPPTPGWLADVINGPGAAGNDDTAA